MHSTQERPSTGAVTLSVRRAWPQNGYLSDAQRASCAPAIYESRFVKGVGFDFLDVGNSGDKQAVRSTIYSGSTDVHDVDRAGVAKKQTFERRHHSPIDGRLRGAGSRGYDPLRRAGRSDDRADAVMAGVGVALSVGRWFGSAFLPPPGCFVHSPLEVNRISKMVLSLGKFLDG